MSKGLGGAVLALLGSKEHVARVLATEWVTPAMVKIRMSCPEFLRPEGEKPASWLRAWFPDPEGSSTLYQRAYTLFEVDDERGEFSLAFVVHDPAGPAVYWAREAEPGDELLIQRLDGDGFTMPDEDLAGYVLVGDAASWPAISTLVATLPEHLRVDVVMECFNPVDRTLPFPDRTGLTVRWVDTIDGSRALVNALDGMDYRGWGSWIAAETVPTRLVRSTLKQDHGHTRSTLQSQAYWVRGRSMGKKFKPSEAGVRADH